MGCQKDIISIHIGQAGLQIGNACWELLCVEHNIGSDGKSLSDEVDNDSFQTFFRLIPSGQYVPRALLIDLEPAVIDEIRTGSYGRLFHPDLIVNCMQDAGNNYARGKLSLGRYILPILLEKIRYICETSDSVQGFFLFNSYGGGTGTGVGSLITEVLSTDFGKRPKIDIGIFPSKKMGTSVLEPYNAVMFTHDTISDCDMSALLNNEALYNICAANLDIESPTFSNINRIISQIVSSITVNMRFHSMQGKTLEEFTGTNLIPYPRLHFPLMSYAPILNQARTEHLELATDQMTRMVFHGENKTVICNMARGRYMSCCLMYRGNFSPREINSAVNDIKSMKELKWVDWCPTGFKISVSSQGPAIIPQSSIGAVDRSVMMLTNHSSVVQSFTRLFLKFDVMFEKRAFIHWFVGEGMEEGEFVEARENMAALELDYKEAVLTKEEFATGEHPEIKVERKVSKESLNKKVKGGKKKVDTFSATSESDVNDETRINIDINNDKILLEPVISYEEDESKLNNMETFDASPFPVESEETTSTSEDQSDSVADDQMQPQTETDDAHYFKGLDDNFNNRNATVGNWSNSHSFKYYNKKVTSFGSLQKHDLLNTSILEPHFSTISEQGDTDTVIQGESNTIKHLLPMSTNDSLRQLMLNKYFKNDAMKKKDSKKSINHVLSAVKSKLGFGIKDNASF